MRLDTATASSVISRSARFWASAVVASSTASSVSVNVSEMAGRTVTDRVTDLMPVNRTRTVIVRAARPAARNRPATRSTR